MDCSGSPLAGCAPLQNYVRDSLFCSAIQFLVKKYHFSTKALSLPRVAAGPLWGRLHRAFPYKGRQTCSEGNIWIQSRHVAAGLVPGKSQPR